MPDLGDATATKSAAYQDVQSARKQLRQARNETPGNGHRRADIREAKQNLRQAKAALEAEQSGGASAAARDEFADGEKAGWGGRVDADGAMDAVDAWGEATDNGAHQWGVDGADGAGVDGVDGAAGADGAPGADAADAPGEPTEADQVHALANGGEPLALGHEVPSINQLHPKGNDGNYYNGDMNCAPAALAMIALGNPNAVLDGKLVSHYPEAALINRIGEHAQTDAQGTAPNALIDTAEAMGFQTSAKLGGLNTDFYDQTLQQGGSIIANGAYYIGEELAGHFVAVTGKTANGNYVVNDPLQGRLEWTPRQLDLFLRSNPTNGGVSIGCW